MVFCQAALANTLPELESCERSFAMTKVEVTTWPLPLGTWRSPGSWVSLRLAGVKWGGEATSKGGHEERFRGSKGDGVAAIGGPGRATGLTRAQEGFAAQGAAGVAEEGSSRQLVPVDAFLPLSGILSLVFWLSRALPLRGAETNLRTPCAFRPPWHHRALGSGAT